MSVSDRRARPTVKDVAAIAGVSPKTVSNVLTGTVFVKPDTRERVESAVDELGFVPNLSARSLRNGRTGVIALALPDLSTAYSAAMLQEFVRGAHARGLAVQVEETAAQPEREFELLSKARAHLVDGLVLNPVTLEDSAVEHSEVLPPVVLIGDVQQQRTDQVWVDSVAASRDLTAHLIDRGARRIAIVGVSNTATSRLRVQGYREAMDAAGLPVDESLLLSTAAWSTAGGDEVMTGLLASSTPVPDAVFALTDSMALGVFGALWRRGLHSPDDVLVCGFDDLEEAAHVSPPLTTVGFDRAAYVAAALELLVDRFTDRDTPARLITIPHRLVVRASTTR